MEFVIPGSCVFITGHNITGYCFAGKVNGVFFFSPGMSFGVESLYGIGPISLRVFFMEFVIPGSCVFITGYNITGYCFAGKVNGVFFFSPGISFCVESLYGIVISGS